MALVLEAQSPTIRLFLEGLMPAQNSEQPCLHLWQGGTYIASSFKDIHAQAHCTAGYLMRKGIQKGDHVGIIASAGLRYHVLNLALQFLGAVNVTIPETFSAAEVEALDRKFDFRLLFVDSVAHFLALGEFPTMKDHLVSVVIGEDEVDALAPEKIVTFDRVVTLGKAAWREDAQQLKDMKAALLPQDLYAILVEPNGKTSRLTIEHWMEAVFEAEKALEVAGAKAMITLLSPDRLIQRAYAPSRFWPDQAPSHAAAPRPIALPLRHAPRIDGPSRKKPQSHPNRDGGATQTRPRQLTKQKRPFLQPPEIPHPQPQALQPHQDQTGRQTRTICLRQRRDRRRRAAIVR
jgi:hypothetical protein